MSGFDNAGVNESFFAGSRIRSNFICSIGHGDFRIPTQRPP
jgi:3-hydroxypropanoate dehydrogenase